jgi:hypothetical protein
MIFHKFVNKTIMFQDITQFWKNIFLCYIKETIVKVTS